MCEVQSQVQITNVTHLRHTLLRIQRAKLEFSPKTKLHTKQTNKTNSHKQTQVSTTHNQQLRERERERERGIGARLIDGLCVFLVGWRISFLLFFGFLGGCNKWVGAYLAS
jgi:hypothetical protein